MFLECPVCGTKYPAHLLGVKPAAGTQLTVKCSVCRSAIEVVVIKKGYFGKLGFVVSARVEDDAS